MAARLGKKLCVVLSLFTASSASTLLASPKASSSAEVNLVKLKSTGDLIHKHQKKGTARPMRRPSDGGAPDVVEFGFFCKSFYGIDIPKGTFSMDIVLTYSWKDPRVSDLLEDHMNEGTMPADIPMSKMWKPEMVIPSREAGGVEIITDFIQIHRRGEAMQVQRLLYTGKAKYDVRDFPFDTQTLVVLIAPASANFEEVVLAPAPNATANGIGDTAFQDKPFYVRGTNQTEFRDPTDPLQKSMGRFEVVASRKALVPLRTVVYPQLLLLCESYSVFFLPLAQFAIMPRVTTCLIAFLAMIGIQGSQNLPPASSTSFMDILNSTVMQMVIAGLILNVFIHFVAFVWKDEPLAQDINAELRYIWAAVALGAFVLCGIGAGAAYLKVAIGLPVLSWVVVLGIWTFNLGFMYWVKRRHDERKAKMERSPSSRG